MSSDTFNEDGPSQPVANKSLPRSKVSKAVIGWFQFEEASLLGATYGSSRLMLGLVLFLLAWNLGLAAMARGQTNNRALELQCDITSISLYCSDPFGAICYARVKMNVIPDGNTTEKVHSYDQYDSPPGGFARPLASQLVNSKINSLKIPEYASKIPNATNPTFCFTYGDKFIPNESGIWFGIASHSGISTFNLVLLCLVTIVGIAFSLYGLFGLGKALVSAFRASSGSLSPHGFIHIMTEQSGESGTSAFGGDGEIDVPLDENDVEKATGFGARHRLDGRSLIRKVSSALLIQFLIAFTFSAICTISDAIQTFAIVTLGSYSSVFIIPAGVCLVALVCLNKTYPWNVIIINVSSVAFGFALGIICPVAGITGLVQGWILIIFIPICFFLFSYVGRDSEYPFGKAYAAAAGAIVLVFILLAIIVPFTSVGQAASCLLAALMLLVFFTWLFQLGVTSTDDGETWIDHFVSCYLVLGIVGAYIVSSVSELKSN